MGLAASGAVTTFLFFGRYQALLVTGAVFIAIVLVALSAMKSRRFIPATTGAVFALLYGSLLPGHLVLIREFPRSSGSALPYGEGASLIFLLFLIVWGCDTGAYFTGRAFGRRKLAPSISPGKTVEGAVGGVVTAVLGAWGGAAFLLPGMRSADVLLLGTSTALVAQTGDLVESLLKRRARTKDSGGWIPGHGGVLDRFDSLILAAPFFYYYIRFSPFGWPGAAR